VPNLISVGRLHFDADRLARPVVKIDDVATLRVRRRNGQDSCARSPAASRQTSASPGPKNMLSPGITATPSSPMKLRARTNVSTSPLECDCSA
jgi:hypothetical protein